MLLALGHAVLYQIDSPAFNTFFLFVLHIYLENLDQSGAELLP